MPECKLIHQCKFFKTRMKLQPMTSELYMNNYCKGIFTNCARYTVFTELGVKELPDDLFPNQREKITAYKK